MPHSFKRMIHSALAYPDSIRINDGRDSRVVEYLDPIASLPRLWSSAVMHVNAFV